MELPKKERAAYIADGGKRCPLCKSDCINRGDFELSESTAWCDVSCTACGTRWVNIYHIRLVTIDDLVIRDP
ncbi:unnamed protein product [marine sediment metagenome]|uniref:Uncharacterized protein n=1 Tax=marine sediment metagenome TaxID=412755 RepID=X0WNW5_9ZZZZ